MAVLLTLVMAASLVAADKPAKMMSVQGRMQMLDSAKPNTDRRQEPRPTPCAQTAGRAEWLR